MTEVADVAALNAAIAANSNGLMVAYFWASFHEACAPGGQLDQVLGVLQEQYPSAAFVKADAEKLSESAEAFGISMVPSFVVIKGGRKLELVEGANPVKIKNAIEAGLAASSASSTSSGAGAGSGEAEGEGEGAGSAEATHARLARLTQSEHVLLFMKGTASEPRCKFSRAMVDLLGEQNVRFATFDVLSDPAVREHLKTFSNWPTFPQLYVGGKFIGGLDTIKELAEKEEGQGLKRVIAESVVAPRVAKQPANAPKAPEVVDDAFLAELVKKAPVMLFMKGSPDAPQCGFSAKIVGLLQSNGITFESFDILENPDVRAQLKTFAKWPTYPQLWVSGALVGGLDIVQEMAEDGDLADQLGIEPIEKRLEALVQKAPVMLFMKGNPDEPRCGFSRDMVQILRDENIEFETFDILEDPEVRAGLKTFSNWPTFPQLYVKGKLVGGLDIVRELRDEGELADALSVA